MSDVLPAPRRIGTTFPSCRSIDASRKRGPRKSSPELSVTLRKACQKANGYWKEAGINVEIRQEDFSIIGPEATKGEHNAAGIGWIQGDPDTVGIILYTKNIDTGYGWTRFRNQELDDTLVAAASTVDGEKRKELYTKVQQITMDNALVLPLYNLLTIYGLHSKVKNFRIDTRGWYPWLYDVYIDES
jgi:peptide/nickel transport system substrate-binding protein